MTHLQKKKNWKNEIRTKKLDEKLTKADLIKLVISMADDLIISSGNNIASCIEEKSIKLLGKEVFEIFNSSYKAELKGGK